MTMGRRAKTTCSPVDNALEKYHNDIGNRLSGVFVPPHPCPANTEESTCDAFSMLTLDFRGKHGVKHTTALAAACQKSSTMPLMNNRIDPNNNINNNNNSKHLIDESDESDSQKDDSAFDQINSTDILRSNTLPSFNSQQNDFSAVSSLKEKRNIMDKLARAIFQRKHTCARCQRRSRSCLQNKTFTLHEKHYTCARCRETSRAFKNFVTGQDSSSSSNTDNTDLSKNNADVILRKPRLQLKDSGYETVTSCSTVASAHSNSNSPYASSNKQNIDSSNSNPCGATLTTTETTTATAPVTPSEVDHEVDELLRKANSGVTVAPYYSPDSHLHRQGHNNKIHDYVNTKNLTNAGIEQYLGGDSNGCRVLKQVKSRYVENYDGYLNLPVNHAHNDESHHSDGYCNCEDSQHPNTDFDTDVKSNNTNTTTNKPNPKMCHICETTSRPCFRLPWDGGWLCEECIDGML